MADFIWLAIITAGKWILKNIGPQILLSLGIGLVSYTGFSALQANFSAYISAMGSNLSQLDALLHILGVFAGIKIFLSAVSIKFSLSIAHRVFPVKASS
ncbi:hypothetical protein BAE30_06100 [Acidithiobacillus caldus]|uniref:DUF2523 domain-containing protein n=1 Tax=Acidithiobacillus caldus TaxID=33059 RepID=A0A1E7YX42_9PROT|nr:hypothetical protein BAE30_06100 [Acidithiobacillus caldus]